MDNVLEHLEQFSEKRDPVLAVLVDRNGYRSIWRSNEFETTANYEWAHRQLLKAATGILAMEPGVGHA